MTQLVEVTRKGPIETITLSAVERRNAISVDMRTQLLSALKISIDDCDVRAIVLTGAGGHFCAGGDLSAAHATAPDPDRTKMNVQILQDIVRLIAGPKPVIAAVEGYAFGAGMSLAAACDFVVAGMGSRFAASFAKLGLSADAGLTWSLPNRVGLARSRRLLMSGIVVESDEALAIGLVDELTEAGGALAGAQKLAAQLSTLAPLSMDALKTIFAGYPYTLDEALGIELANQVRLVSSADYIEGRTAFIEKRTPVFKGV